MLAEKQVFYGLALSLCAVAVVISTLALTRSRAACPATVLGCTASGCTSTVPITIKGGSLDRHATLTLNDTGDLDIEVADDTNGGERSVYRLGTDGTIAILDNIGTELAVIGPDCLSTLAAGPTSPSS